jgi:prophage tail gpP-like protein
LGALHTYRHLPRTGPAKIVVQANLPSEVKDIAAKAQTRLCARYRALSAKGKKPTVTVTALARELSGFVWAIGSAVQTA